MRLFYVRAGRQTRPGRGQRTWLIVAESEGEAVSLVPDGAGGTVEAVRDLPPRARKDPGVIGWMGPSQGTVEAGEPAAVLTA